ncbi:MAG TPA: branched-chain amino acid ABC transporter permease [Bosea sp. (in: a-proteobacteria)]|uniref:branched-chain amino acid ABC transporter permease n=1 Tax=Bosea sp. (in: a-proteobacteria) TaxID=1871050 RepID=UPI002E138B3F|nr:branched-chain amino acid ABC transporter permease [Bosea sp. (in: a-proteobacteria)]
MSDGLITTARSQREFGRPGRLSLGQIEVVAVLIFAALPFWLSNFWTYTLSLTLANAILILSVSFLIRYGGEVSIGQNFFAAGGAYAVAILQTRYGIPFPVGAMVGAAAGVLTGLIFSWPSRNLSGVYLSVATLALGLCVPEILLQWSSLTGGFEGLYVEPNLVPGVASGVQQFYVALAGLGITVIALARFRGSRFGLALLTARYNPKAAEAFGMSLPHVRLLVFAISSGIAGFGGSVLAFASSTVSPNSFSFLTSVYLLVGAVVSLYSTRMIAAVVGGMFITLVPLLMSEYGEIVPIIYGLALFVVIYMANIVVPAAQAAIRRRKARA